VLSPFALAIVFFYSLTKRFTNFTHFFLGAALAVAPIGAWIATTGKFEMPPFWLAAGVLCWVAGFDLIYATQDYDFDRSENLHSLVVRLGISRSLRVAQTLHFAMLATLVAFGISADLHAIYFASLAFVLVAIIYEHRAAKRLDVDAINRAFFSSNAFVSAIILIATCADVCLTSR
jgi:4-hydroxybenzoate polyprenyltransferase